MIPTALRGARLYASSAFPTELLDTRAPSSETAYLDTLRKAICHPRTYRVDIAAFLVRRAGLEAMGLWERLTDGSPLTVRLVAFPPLGLVRRELEALRALPTVEVREIATTDTDNALSHLKLVVVHHHDWGAVAFFGSSNLTHNGLKRNLELNTAFVLPNEPTDGNPRAVFEGLWAQSREPHPELYVASDAPAALRNLLDFQLEAYRELRSALESESSVALVLPTGAGKTMVAMRYIVQEVLREPGARVLWIAPMRELLEQALSAYHASQGFAADNGLRVRLHTGGSKEAVADAHLELWTIQALHRRRRREPSPSRVDLLVLDEAHWGIGRSNEMTPRILEWAQPRKRLGLTATPFRGIFEEQVDFGRTFRKQVPSTTPSEEVTNSAGQRVFSIVEHEKVPTGLTIELELSDAKLHRYRVALADDAKILRDEVNEPSRNRLVAETWFVHRDKWGPTLLFAIGTKHANALAGAFAEEAVAAKQPPPRIQVVHTGEIPTDLCVVEPATGKKLGWDERHEIARRLRAGEIDVVIAVDLYNMGVDFPAVGTLFLARPTLSPVRYMQMIGRGLRGPAFAGTAVCHVVDFCDQVRAHRQAVDILMSYDVVKLAKSDRIARRREQLVQAFEAPDEAREVVYGIDHESMEAQWYWTRDRGDDSPCFLWRGEWTTPAKLTAELGGPDAVPGTFWVTEFTRTLEESRALKRRRGLLRAEE